MFKPSLTKILAKFETTISELKALEQSNEKAIEQNNDRVAELERRKTEVEMHSRDLRIEMSAASAVRVNLEKLLGR